VSVPPGPSHKTRFPALSNEVVLFYCSCWQSYSMQNDSAGAGGFLYLTENYVGLVCRSVLGLTKRKELFLLHHLTDVADWKSSSSSSSSSQEGHGGSRHACGDGVGRAAGSSSSSSSPGGGGILASLASATGLSYLTSGCKLSFEVTPQLRRSSGGSGGGRSEGAPGAGTSALDTLCIDVFIIPGVPVDRLRTLLLGARDSQSSSLPPHSI
jgi:hypothetical protein